MKREYTTGTADDVVFFKGTEVEKTPAFGMETLFVTGIQEIETIQEHAHGISHIFFGANHSYNPVTSDEFEEWDVLIHHFVKKGILCSLDIPTTVDLEWFLEGGLIEKENFIPQIRVVIPYIKQWNYNAMVKIDDKGFNQSNPGVWCHSLHDLMDRTKFTDWAKYGLDKPLK